MDMISVCAVGIFAVICAAALRKYSGEAAALMLISAVIMLTFIALPYAESMIRQIRMFSDAAFVKTEYLQALLKSVGICYLTHITADICRENGGQSTASQVELCGRLAILMIACPLYADILTMVSSFLQ